MNRQEDFNMVYPADIEQKLKTRPITEMPEFKPRIMPEQAEQLQAMNKEMRQIVTPLILALSVSDQRTEWAFGHLIHLNSMQRENEVEKIASRKSWKDSLIWIIQTIFVSVATAAATLALHK